MLKLHQGMGIVIRDETHQDIDEDIDIDGEDEALYGAAQFTEVDVLGRDLSAADEDEDVRIDDDDAANQSPGVSGTGMIEGTAGPSTVRNLIAQGQVINEELIAGVQFQEVKMAMEEIMGIGETEALDRSIELARKSGSPSALVEALENKVKLLVSTLSALNTSTVADLVIRRQLVSRHLRHCFAGSA